MNASARVTRGGRGDRLGQAAADALAHQIVRPLFDFFINAADVLGQDADRHQLDAAEEHHAHHNGGVARHGDAGDEIFANDPQAVAQRDQRQQRTGQRQGAQGRDRERQNAGEGQRQRATQTKVALAVESRQRFVVDGGAVETDPGVQALHETVAFGQALERVNDLAVHQAKVAGVGRNFHAIAQVDQFVKPAGQGDLQTRLVVPRAPDGVDHVGAVAPLGQHLRGQRHRVLPVAVHQQHHVAARRLDAGGQRWLLAKITRQLQVDHLRVRLAHHAHHGGSVVATAVVDDDQFDLRAQAGQGGQHLVDQRRQVAGFVVCRDDAAQGRAQVVTRLHRWDHAKRKPRPV